MTTLQFLLLEDNPLDADVVRLTLTEGGINCNLQIVDTRTKFETALNAEPFDLILADYALPGFDGLTALEIAQNQCLDIPFIFVSASLGEELAIESLKMGATDYVLKQRLGRLVPCVERALREAQEKRDRKSAEAALRESEDRLRLAIESAQLGTWDWDLITNQLTWDAGCKAMFGLPPEAETSIDIFFEGLHPDDRDRLQQVVQHSLNPASGGSYDTEYRTIGLQDQVERWVKAKGQVYFDATGTPFRFIGTVLDVTEQRQTEAAIAADFRDTQLLHNLSIQLISETSIEVIYNEIVSAASSLTQADAGTFQYLDSSNELRLLAADGLSQTLIDHFGCVTASSPTSCGRALLHGERAFIDFEASPDPDGSLKLLLDEGFIFAQSTPLISRSGQFIGMVSTHWRRHHQLSDRELRFLDLLARQAADLIEQRQAIAERQRLLERERAAREEAERVNRIKDEFLAVLSHELRSPLNPILAWSKLLQMKKFDQTKLQQGLSTIERNVRLQTQLIDDLLDVAKILRGKLELTFVPIDLATVTRSAMEVVKAAAEAKSISLQLELQGICQVRGDEARLQQIVWNLLANAVKFTPRNGRVVVRLEQVSGEESGSDGATEQRNHGATEQEISPPLPFSPAPSSPTYAQITVTDTGHGIDQDFLPYIFQSFRQADASTTRQYGGLGLGLSIVKHLVDAHGGVIRADSAGENQGATFTVQFPLYVDETVQPSVKPPAATDLELAGTKILAVDDLEDARNILVTMLAHYGADVKVVTSGKEVLDDLQTFQPDVLVCDIGMPQMDGYDLIRRIRSLPTEKGGATPAIAVTAYVREEDYQRTLNSGFQRHLAKPIEPEQLILAIADLVMN